VQPTPEVERGRRWDDWAAVKVPTAFLVEERARILICFPRRKLFKAKRNAAIKKTIATNYAGYQCGAEI
jgi:hypothetical protein